MLFYRINYNLKKFKSYFRHTHSFFSPCIMITFFEKWLACTDFMNNMWPLVVSTWSAGLYSRSTCPCAAVSCWVWQSRWRRTAVWWPVGPARCRCRAEAACNKTHPAASEWTPASESSPRGHWPCASSFLWASRPSHPEWSPAPTWLVLRWGKEGMIKQRVYIKYENICKHRMQRYQSWGVKCFRWPWWAAGRSE